MLLLSFYILLHVHIKLPVVDPVITSLYSLYSLKEIPALVTTNDHATVVT